MWEIWKVLWTIIEFVMYKEEVVMFIPASVPSPIFIPENYRFIKLLNMGKIYKEYHMQSVNDYKCVNTSEEYFTTSYYCAVQHDTHDKCFCIVKEITERICENVPYYIKKIERNIMNVRRVLWVDRIWQEIRLRLFYNIKRHCMRVAMLYYQYIDPNISTSL